MAMIHLDSTPSTNSWCKENSPRLNNGDSVLTHNQTAGRGQRGNSWEAAPGMNLTMSLFLRPEGIVPARQFLISEAVAIGVADTVEQVLGKRSDAPVRIKWPNDIYVGDRKIAGILIENVIAGSSLSQSIAGIGLNVNQTEFISDASNPVSLRQLTSETFDIEEIAQEIVIRIIALLADQERLHDRFLRYLWRFDGKPYPFRFPDGSMHEFVIDTVLPEGFLRLRDYDGLTRDFAFKEIAFIL